MKRRKKKLNFKRILIFILIILFLVILVVYLLNIKTKNIIILNNDYYTDEEVIEKSNIQDYPKFLLLSKSKIRKKLKQLDLIEDATITKKFGSILEIDIKDYKKNNISNEKKILYYVRSKDKYMASDNELYDLDNVIGVPTLINYVPDNIESSFVKELSKIDKNIISLISEIEYAKTTYDEKRFLLYMNDGNEVYVTITKLDLLNKYIDIVKKLDNKNGILYLDSGNYFEIKK